uniref:arrestin domain-containing protein 2-like isoform X2 n=1 Tax=Styela clava TaxID=7725 RepID=UPI00193934E2|nr:arrestin domain-containing protein 2-like isoform X2 [Styela clava]
MVDALSQSMQSLISEVVQKKSLKVEFNLFVLVLEFDDFMMGKLTKFKIHLVDDKDIYHSGEEVVGEVKIKLSEAMQMKGVRLTFSGKAHVDWEEGSDDSKSSYWATQNLFYKEIYVYGRGSSDANDTVELSPGSHTFSFNFTLPHALPSSYEDFGCFIRYFIKASIVKPWKFDHNTKKVFTVLDTLDLNTIPTALASPGDSQSKSFCCMCCTSGPIELEFYLDRTGYVPGEFITINANVTNSSDRNLTKTTAELYKDITYRAQGREKKELKFVTKITGDGCPPKESLTWTNKKMQIPSLPPTELRHCDIIDVEYLVQFTVHTPAFSISLRGKAPIVIGTVPLRHLPEYRRTESETIAVEFSRTPPPSFSTLPANDLDVTYNNFPPPPSYVAATQGSTNVRDNDDNEFTMGEMSYTPHYTYYDWGQTELTVDDSRL